VPIGSDELRGEAPDRGTEDSIMRMASILARSAQVVRMIAAPDRPVLSRLRVAAQSALSAGPACTAPLPTRPCPPEEAGTFV
jgi:hypothetical protein